MLKCIKFLRTDNSSEPDIYSERFGLPTTEQMTSTNTLLALLEKYGELDHRSTSFSEMYQYAQPKLLLSVMNFILTKSENLHTYINRFPVIFPLPLVERISGRLNPTPFLTKSFVRLEIGSAFRLEVGVTARNATWILIFCSNLRQAVLTVLFGILDYKFLSESVELFKGLSNLKDLAVKFREIDDEKNYKTWWGKPGFERRASLLGSRKTDCVDHSLQVTKGLTSIELWVNRFVPRKGDRELVYERMINGLASSYMTLKHVRLAGARINRSDSTLVDYSLFKTLKTVTLDLSTLRNLHEVRHRQLPKSL